jgi:hypothetical protein
VTHALFGLWSVARVTLIEAWRQRLAWLFVLVGLGFVAVIPGMQAVDDSARLKLTVVTATGALGFVITLLAILVAGSSLRRDLDGKFSYILFAKPLPRVSYLLGRWLGVQAGLLAGISILCVAAIAAVALQPGKLPVMLRICAAQSWQHLTAAGELLPIDAAKERLNLSGATGNGIRWRFSGLSPDQGYTALIQGGIANYYTDAPIEEATILALAVTSDGAQQQFRELTLAADSPYGKAPNGALMRHRDQWRRDLTQDYLRLNVPRDAIAPDGSLVVQITRLDPRSTLIFHRGDSAKLVLSSGDFSMNFARAGLVQLAIAGLLAAFALWCATISNTGVTLLAGLTLYFGGQIFPLLGEMAADDTVALPLRRAIELVQRLLPDFSRFDVAANIAASREVPWSMVGQAWTHYGVYMTIFLALAWTSLRRKEL